MEAGGFGSGDEGRHGRWGTRTSRLAAVAVALLALLIAGIVVLARGDGSDVDTAGPGTTAGSSTTSSTRPPSTTSSSQPTTSQPATTAPATSGPEATPPPATAPSGPAGVISRLGGGGRRVALTFDAGSDAGHAAQILDVLAAEGIRATFGITGRFAERNPALVRRIASEGHQLVNHSYDHPSFTGYSTETAPLSAAQRADQLRRAESAIVAASGVGSGGWFRPPYGDIDDGVLRDVAAAGWPTVLMWTVDSLGWKGIGADAVVQRCLDRAEPGAIYLFHVGQESDDAAALQRIVDGLQAAGYGFTRVAG